MTSFHPRGAHNSRPSYRATFWENDTPAPKALAVWKPCPPLPQCAQRALLPITIRHDVSRHVWQAPRARHEPIGASARGLALGDGLARESPVSPISIPLALALGAPLPGTPPCIRQRLFPATFGARHGAPERVRAPHWSRMGLPLIFRYPPGDSPSLSRTITITLLTRIGLSIWTP
jgi:hypothetical protein